MRLPKTSIWILFVGACLVCVTRASPVQVKDHESTRTFQSSSSSFGVKTSAQSAPSNQRGHFSEVISTNAHVQSGNEKPLLQSSQSATSGDQLSQKSQDVISPHVSSEDQYQQSPDNFHSVQESPVGKNDETIFGLLPAEASPQRPANFGTRITQGRNTQDSCNVKGGCDTLSTRGIGNQFPDDSFGNQQSHQEQSVEFHAQQNEGQNIQTGVGSSKQDIAQQQDEIDQLVDELDQEVREVFGSDFTGNDQYENTFQDTDLKSLVDETNVPIVDSEYSEDGNGHLNFQTGEGTDSYQDQDERTQTNTALGDFEDSQNPEFFGYIEPRISTVDQTSEDAFQEPKQQSFSFGTGGEFSVDQSRGDTGDQGNFQQRFVPQRQVSNDKGSYYQDEGQNQFLSDRDPIEALRYNVPGSPGDDYPIFYKVPETSFQCNQQQFAAGIYGDTDAQCQVFHFCKETGGQDSFLCPNGTVFNQQYFVCDWWYNYNCSDTPSFYNLNAQLYWDFDSLAPSQMLSGAQVGSQDEFHDQQGTQVGFNRPTQNFGGVRNQDSVLPTRFPSRDSNPQHIPATRQQVTDSRIVSEQHTTTSADKRIDGNVIHGTNRVSTVTQTNTVQTGSFDFHSTSHTFDSTSGGQIPRTHQQGTISDSTADDFSQNPIEPIDFQQRAVPDQAGFIQSQVSTSDQTAHSDDFSETDVNQAPVEDLREITYKTTIDDFEKGNLNEGFDSSLPDVHAQFQPSVNDDVQQNTFAQQHVEDEQSVAQGHDTLSQQQGTTYFNSNFESTRDLTTIFESNQFPQDTQSGFTSSQDNSQEIQQQDIDLASDGRRGISNIRNEAGINVVDKSVTTASGGYGSQNIENQQQANIDSSFEDPYFMTREVSSVPLPENVGAFNGQSGFESSGLNNDQQVIKDVTHEQAIPDEKFSQENLDVQDFNTDVPLAKTAASDSGSQRDASAFSRNDLPSQEVINTANINQDKVDFDEILDGFRTRNVAFKDTSSGSELTGVTDGKETGQTSSLPDNGIQRTKQDDNDFGQKPFEEVSFPQDEIKDSNDGRPRQDISTVFQQQNIQVDDIFNMMRGLPGISTQQKFQNGQSGNQQRLSFKPHGQSTTPNLNLNTQRQNNNRDNQNNQDQIQTKNVYGTQSTFDRGNQNQQHFNFRPYGQNTTPQLNSNDVTQGQNGNNINIHQDVSQRNSEQVVFPDTRQNEERRTNSWRPTQQRKNVNFQDLSDQPVQTFIEQSNSRGNQNNQAQFFHGSVNTENLSNRNQNTKPNNPHQSTQGFQGNLQQGAVPNINVGHGNQNRLTGRENTQSQFRNSVQFNAEGINLQAFHPNSGIKGFDAENQHQSQADVRNRVNENNQNDENGRFQFQNQQDHPGRKHHTTDENFQRNSLSGENFDQGQIQDQFNSRPPFQAQNTFNAISQGQNTDQFNSRPVVQNQNTQFDGRPISQDRNVDQLNSRAVPQNQNFLLDGRHSSQEQNADQFNSRPVPQNQNVHFDGRHKSQEQNAEQFNSRAVPQNQNVHFDGRHISQEQNADQFNSRPAPQNQNVHFDGRHIPQEQDEGQFNSRAVSQNQNVQFEERPVSQEQFETHFNSRPEQGHNSVHFNSLHISQNQNTAQFNSRSASQGENNIHVSSGHGQQVQRDAQFNSRSIAQDQNVAQFNFRPDQQSVHPSDRNPQTNHPGVKGFETNARESRSHSNFGQPNGQINPQKIEASDVRIYSQNDPSSAASSVNYNGWRPIVRQ